MRLAPRTGIAVAVALVSATLLVLAGSGGPARAGCGAWRSARPPAAGGGIDRFLFGVGTSSSGEAWAVGSSRSPGGASRTLAMHWDGDRWVPVPTPNHGTGDNFLNAITVVSPTDAWAGGFWRGADGVARTLVLRWDGRRWSLVDSPNPGDGEHVLSSASATGGDDVWLAGYSRLGSAFRSLILHWDGTSLHATYPADVAQGGEAIGAVSSAGDTALAVGGYALDNGGTAPLVLRWDGSEWRRDASRLDAEHGTVLAGVAASPSGSAWVVGGYPGIGTSAGFAAAFDDGRWRTFTRRSVGTGDSLSGVAAFAGGAWAVGSYVEDRVERTLIERGGDDGWRRVPSPNVGGRDNHLLDVTALPTGEAWAVGSTTDAEGREAPLIQHYCPA
jgi:hypothetical protein